MCVGVYAGRLLLMDLLGERLLSLAPNCRSYTAVNSMRGCSRGSRRLLLTGEAALVAATSSDVLLYRECLNPWLVGDYGHVGWLVSKGEILANHRVPDGIQPYRCYVICNATLRVPC